jgi:hypothetical protein
MLRGINSSLPKFRYDVTDIPVHFEVLIGASIFSVTPCNLQGYPEDAGSMFLQNVNTLLPNYRVSHFRRI